MSRSKQKEEELRILQEQKATLEAINKEYSKQGKAQKDILNITMYYIAYCFIL